MAHLKNKFCYIGLQAPKMDVTNQSDRQIDRNLWLLCI